MIVINGLGERSERDTEQLHGRRFLFAVLTNLATLGLKNPRTRADYHALRRRMRRRLVIEGGAAH